jgi:hypothetical protein
MTFPVAKNHLIPTYLYSPSRNRRYPLKKKRKRNVNGVPKTRKKRKPHLLLSLSRNPGPGRCSLKKKRKRNVNDVPKTKKTKKSPPYTYLEPNSGLKRASPKEKKRKER